MPWQVQAWLWQDPGLCWRGQVLSDPALSKGSEASAIRPGHQSSLPHAPDWAAYFPSWSLSFLTSKTGINTRLTLESRRLNAVVCMRCRVRGLTHEKFTVTVTHVMASFMTSAFLALTVGGVRKGARSFTSTYSSSVMSLRGPPSMAFPDQVLGPLTQGKRI